MTPAETIAAERNKMLSIITAAVREFQAETGTKVSALTLRHLVSAGILDATASIVYATIELR